MRLRFLKMVVAVAAMFAGVAQADEITVGGKNFTEQFLLSSMTAQLLEANGFDVDIRSGMGSAAVRQAMENGQIDVYWEYTGTSLITYNKVAERLDADETYIRVKELDAAKGIVWLNPSRANSTYALAMRSDRARELGIATDSDLAARLNGNPDLTLAANTEFYARPDGLKPFQKAYGFEIPRDRVVRMDAGLIHEALKNGDVDVGIVIATDGKIPALDLVTLEDDQGFFPAYALVPVARIEALKANQSIGGLLNALSSKLDDATMAKLNARVDVERESIEQVAADFLKKAGLINRE
ncbi:glycine betaine ABC transporter substrate-binding protein [Leisingera daeponensis]|uniref:Glycine betaine ABC transporter substrate-binding protein n=1 Tax=Leisingera daeponensis TaxID=405746 RepID=A0ABS7NMK9_9RHOB|nr:glycine betaine ABC transporter substrate-binding protein [Leisingera daeponensis]MBY6142166.1 glycine betaine ABC transporter substrate-binding protein [Leisingera daeponensis]